jgi:hypothetical protein
MSPACTGSVKRCAAELGVISACVLVLVLVVVLALDALAAGRAFVLAAGVFEEVEPHHPARPADTRDPTFVEADAPAELWAPVLVAAPESRAPTALNCTGVFHRHHISSLRHATAPPRTSIPMQSPTCAILRTGVRSCSRPESAFVVVCFGCGFVLVFVCGFEFAPPLAACALEACVVELDVVAPDAPSSANPTTSPAGT